MPIHNTVIKKEISRLDFDIITPASGKLFNTKALFQNLKVQIYMTSIRQVVLYELEK